MTLLLAWINAKYNKDYTFLFVMTFILDYNIINYILSRC